MDTLSKDIVNKSKLFALTVGLALAAAGAIAPSAQAATYNLDFNSSADGGSILYNSNGTLDTTQWDAWGLKGISGINNYNKTNGIDDGKAKLNIYDTNVFESNRKNRDWDLTTGTFERRVKKNGQWTTQVVNTGTEKQGGALIIQEESNGGSYKNGAYTADDEAAGGNILFDFDGTVDFNSFSLLDIDDNGGGIKVEGTRADGGLLNIDVDALMAEYHRINGKREGTNTQGTFVALDGVKMTQVGRLQGDNSMFRFDVDDAYLTDVRFSYPGSGAISGLEWGTVEVPQEIPEPSAIGGLLMLGFIGKRVTGKRSEAAA